MLQQIKIKNLAIIEDLEIDFTSNFTALTGATGAGKSLVIDSLKLIFGQRADSDYIRYNEDEAIIQASFTNLNQEVKEYLKTIQINDNNIIIERWISRKDRNKILINNKSTSLKELRELGLLLGDIHEQHDTHKLLDPVTALTMIDEFAKNEKLLNEYVMLRHVYLESLNKYEKALKKTSETNELLDDLKFQLDELEKANLDILELESLNETILTLRNQKEILHSLNEAYNNLKEIEEKNLLYGAKTSLEKVKDYGASFTELEKRLANIYYEAEDLKMELYNELDNVSDYKLDELEDLENRSYFLNDLQNKYKKDIKELIDYQEILKEEILKAENYDLFLEKLKQTKNETFLKAYNKGLELRNKRKNFALQLEEEFIKVLLKLDIDYVLFKVSFKEVDKELLKEDGIDEVEFLISLNEGEPLKPFYKVASGGELSRSMLALKIMYGNIHNLGLMVFDEIDLGISGDAASKVANKLLQLSKSRQVITITHLPQVAAKATKHFNIEKRVVKKRTTTIIKDLDYEERVFHLAYMLSGKNLTEGAISHAKELLGNKKSL